jgi:hypothetical protein
MTTEKTSWEKYLDRKIDENPENDDLFLDGNYYGGKEYLFEHLWENDCETLIGLEIYTTKDVKYHEIIGNFEDFADQTFEDELPEDGEIDERILNLFKKFGEEMKALNIVIHIIDTEMRPDTEALEKEFQEYRKKEKEWEDNNGKA